VNPQQPKPNICGSSCGMTEVMPSQNLPRSPKNKLRADLG
jgi:hypothetical protein